MKIPEFLPGDLIFYHNNSFLGWLIRVVTRGKGEPATFSNHVAGFISNNDIVEALWTVKISRFVINPEGKQLKVYRRKGVSEDQRNKIAKNAIHYVGEWYGLTKLITHLGDALLEKMFGGQIFFFRKLNHSDKYPICSWVWAFSYKRALGYQFGIQPEGADPDTIYDYVVKNNTWELIYYSDPEGVCSNDSLCWSY